jgi:2-keto-4-pentenoate hydratase/2-oxohepta-3-ene-1,7-dioic acid hydratase in catechol pathway
MGSPTPAAPIWFWKPQSAIIGEGQAIRIPAGIGAVHHEVELAIRIGKDGLPHAFTVAIDVTARDLQQAAKEAGRPWAQAKGYDTFLPLGPWCDATGIDLQALELRLGVDDEVRQHGSTSDMTWPVATLLAMAAQWTTFFPGDVLLTGTPEGVGPIVPGQRVCAEIIGHCTLSVPVVARN